MVVIFCRKDGLWKRKIKKGEETTLFALGEVKTDVLEFLKEHDEFEILDVNVRDMRKKNRGFGLKIKVRSD